jgi:hypothetical protein
MDIDKLAYTIIFDNKYIDKYEVRKNNLYFIKKTFDKNIKYIDAEVFFIENLEDYKNILKNNIISRKINLNGTFRLGAIGLIFTTYFTYLKFIETDYDYFLVIEDDAKIDKNSLNTLKNYLEEIPKDFDVLSLYDNIAYYNKYKSIHDIGLKNICLSYNDKSTLAYIISKKGVKKYINFMQSVIDNPIDLFLFDDNKNTKKYAIKPSSDQIFFNSYFLKNGDPDFENSLINKTLEIRIK